MHWLYLLGKSLGDQRSDKKTTPRRITSYFQTHGLYPGVDKARKRLYNPPRARNGGTPRNDERRGREVRCLGGGVSSLVNRDRGYDINRHKTLAFALCALQTSSLPCFD